LSSWALKLESSKDDAAVERISTAMIPGSIEGMKRGMRYLSQQTKKLSN
jgi:hypothetical protein